MLKKILIGLVVLAIILFGVFKYMQFNTKKYSPEVHKTYKVGDATVKLFYCSPSKNDREIFGNLVPYGEVWRTGANEPTTLETDKPITLGNQSLPAGKYSLWTIPGKESWNVILNTKIPGWGIGFNGKAQRNPKGDIVNVTAPVSGLPAIQENLRIDIDSTLSFPWDNVRVAVPIGRL